MTYTEAILKEEEARTEREANPNCDRADRAWKMAIENLEAAEDALYLGDDDLKPRLQPPRVAVY